MKARDRDRVVQVAGRARAFAALDETYAEAGKAGEAILHAYASGGEVTSEAVGRLCAAFHDTGLYAGCGEDTRKRLKAVYAVGAWDESKHKRDKGKFAKKEGANGGDESEARKDKVDDALYERAQSLADGIRKKYAGTEDAENAKKVADLLDGGSFDAAEKVSRLVDSDLDDFLNDRDAMLGGRDPEHHQGEDIHREPSPPAQEGGGESALNDQTKAWVRTMLEKHGGDAEKTAKFLSKTARAPIRDARAWVAEATEGPGPTYASAVGPVTTDHVRKRGES